MPSKQRPSPGAIVSPQTGAQLLRLLGTHVHSVLERYDIEAVHQIRVAIRRLRVLLALGNDRDPARPLKHLLGELRWLRGALAPARDLDILLTEIWPRVHERLGATSLAAQLERQWIAQRRPAERAVQQVLRASRARTLLRKIEEWFGAGVLPQRGSLARRREVRHLVRHEIKTCMRRVRRRHAAIDPGDTLARHRLRIALRRLRYTIELCMPWMERRRTTAMLKRLARLQNVLGAMNDLEVAQSRIEAALGRRRSHEAMAMRQSLAAWRAAQMEQLMPKFHRAWRAYQRTKAPC